MILPQFHQILVLDQRSLERFMKQNVTAGKFGFVYRGNVEATEVHFGPFEYMHIPSQQN